VPGTSGDYGLPAASRYGPAGPPRPVGHPEPDTGVELTDDDSSTPNTASTQLITPHHPDKILEVDVHTPTVSLVTLRKKVADNQDDSFRRTLGHAEQLAQAQGEQQNEISRYLHGVSDQIDDGRRQQNMELANVLAELGRLRAEMQPKHVTGHVLPDGRVVLANGDVVQGVKGVAPPITAASVPLPKTSGGTVHGEILPDGTVMADGKIVDGIAAKPSASTPINPQIVKDTEQDRKLAALEAKSTFTVCLQVTDL
jgi:hypothetical protein